MIPYVIIFISSLILSFLYEKSKKTRFFYLLLLILILFAGFRLIVDYNIIFGDEKINRINFAKYQWNDLFTSDMEVGFVLWNIILKQIYNHSQMLIFFSALATLPPMLMFLKKHSKNFTLSIFLFFVLGYYLQTFNILQQALVMIFVLFSTKYIFERNFLKYVGVLLLGSLIHQTALFLIPLYFLYNVKPWSKYYVFLFLGLVVVLVFFEPIMIMLNSLGVISDEYYSSMNSVGAGINPLFVMYYSLPLILLFVFRKKMIFNPKEELFLNMYFVGFLFMILSLKFVYFSRFDLYFGMYICIIIPYIFKILKTKEEKFFIVYTFCMVYGAIFVIRLFETIPYHLILFN